MLADEPDIGTGEARRDGTASGPATRGDEPETACYYPVVHPERVFDEPVTTADLLTAWRDAIRAAELAERLAVAATDAASQADVRASGSEEIAALAERAAEAATRAAERARTAAAEAAQLAASLRGMGIPAAEANVTDMRRIETDAAAAYRDAEQHGRRDGR